MRLNERAYYLLSGVIMIVGSLLSSNGGREHPTVSMQMGAYGSSTFFYHFAVMMALPNWESIHAQILAGPVLWVLGGLALTALIRAAGWTKWAVLGGTALAMGATLWVVTYIFDGFASDRIAPLIRSGDPTLRPAYEAAFGADQWVAIRTSFVAWMLIAVGTAVLAIGLGGAVRKFTGLGKVLTITLVVLGSILGVWSITAAATGAYAPGPMVSKAYLPALIGTQWWYIFAGLLVIYLAVVRPRTGGERMPKARFEDDADEDEQQIAEAAGVPDTQPSPAPEPVPAP